MKRFFLLFVALLGPPAFALTVAILLEGIFGFGAWLYWTLGVIGVLFALAMVAMVWRDDISNQKEMLIGEVAALGVTFAFMGAAAAFFASYDLAWSQAMRGYTWNDWQRAHGRIVGGSVTTYYTDSKYSAFNRHSTSFEYEFEVEGVKFNGSDGDSGQGEMGTGVYIWYNPRDPVQNLGRMKDNDDPFPSVGVWHVFYFAALGCSAGATLFLALGLAMPLRIGWWLPPVTAGLVAVGIWGGDTLGQSRAESRAWFMQRSYFGEDGALADLWRRSHADGAPVWRGRWAIQWVIALTRRQGKEQADAQKELASVTPAEPEAIPVLLEILRFDAEHAKIALHRVGKAAVPGLLEIASGKDRNLQAAAAEVLGGFPEEAAAIVPVLTSLTNTRDYALLLRSIESQGALAATSDLALEHLIAQLDSRNRDAIHPALVGLSKLGPRAKPAEKRLRELAQDPAFAEWAGKCLKGIAGGP